MKFLLALAVATLALSTALACGGSYGGDEDTRTAVADETADVEDTPEDAETPVDDETPFTGDEVTYEELIDLTIADLDEFWAATVPEIYDIAYTRWQPSGHTSSPKAMCQSAVGRSTRRNWSATPSTVRSTTSSRGTKRLCFRSSTTTTATLRCRWCSRTSGATPCRRAVSSTGRPS